MRELHVNEAVTIAHLLYKRRAARLKQYDWKKFIGEGGVSVKYTGTNLTQVLQIILEANGPVRSMTKS
jgi:hypothetical protein